MAKRNFRKLGEDRLQQVKKPRKADQVNLAASESRTGKAGDALKREKRKNAKQKSGDQGPLDAGADGYGETARGG